MQQMIFIADLIACSTCFGHHYAHHQELESIIQNVASCGIWCLVFKLSVWCGAEGYASGLRAAASSWHFISTYYVNNINCLICSKLKQPACIKQHPKFSFKFM